MALTLDRIVPTEALADTGDVLLSVTGTGITEDTTKLFFDNQRVDFTFIDATAITAIISTNGRPAGPVAVELEQDYERTPALTFTFIQEVTPEPPPVDDTSVGYPPNDETYGKIAEETAWPEGHSASYDGDEDTPTSNTPGGGLPLYPKEPYPTGNPPTRTYAQITGIHK